MKIVGIIPARYASTRLPAKALADIGGKPMIQHVVEQCRGSRLMTDLFVATDDERIEHVVNGFGGSAIMTPTTIQSGSDRIAYAARALHADIVVNIQGDEPLIEPEMIDQAIQLLIADRPAQVGTLVKRITSSGDLLSPNVVKVVLDEKMNALYFSRSAIPYARDAGAPGEWLTTVPYFKHVGLYVYNADFLQRFATLPQLSLERAEKLEQLRVLEHGYRIIAAITDFDTIPVDTQEDLNTVRSLVQARASTKKKP